MTGLFISAFALGIAFCAPPGAVTAEALRRGLARGFRPALFLELGSLVGDATWAAVALIGASVLVQNGPVRLLLSVAGACLLLRLAWSALREARAGHTPLAKIENGAGRGDFAAGAMVSLTNPSAIAFWVSVGGAIAATGVDDPTARHFAVFFTGFMAAAVLWCFFISGLISWGRRLLSASFFRWVNLACAAALALLGLRLLVDTLLTL
jgi:chemosensory pili system protein ChpE